MDDDSILVLLKKTFKESLGANPELIKAGATPDHIPEWDSLGHGILVMEIENVFNISLDIDNLMEMEDINSMIKVIKRKLS